MQPRAVYALPTVPKLYCYFPDASYPTELDTDTQTLGFIWKIGRQPKAGDRTGLYFRGGSAQFVSRTHAAIRWRPLGYQIEGEEAGVWELIHASATNPTWYKECRSSNQLQNGEWIEIKDGDRFFFGDPANWISFGLYGMDTLEVAIINETPTADLSEAETQIEIKSGHWIPDAIEEIGKLIKGLTLLQFLLCVLGALGGVALYLLLSSFA